MLRAQGLGFVTVSSWFLSSSKARAQVPSELRAKQQTPQEAGLWFRSHYPRPLLTQATGVCLLCFWLLGHKFLILTIALNSGAQTPRLLSLKTHCRIVLRECYHSSICHIWPAAQLPQSFRLPAPVHEPPGFMAPKKLLCY